MTCEECGTCRWWRMRSSRCALPGGPAIETVRGERRCWDYEKAVGEDWHAMLYGNCDTRWNHL
jgi:hypothetical protein